MIDHERIELEVSLEKTAHDLVEATQMLEELVTVTGATYNGKRWIMPLPCQEPVMRELAPEELLRSDDDICVLLRHFENLWHVMLVKKFGEGILTKCLYHGMDKEQTVKAGLEEYQNFRQAEGLQ